MKKMIPFLLICSVFVGACSKSYEERITGNWQLDRAWREQFLGRDYFTTGYESGIFTFKDNGDASYVSGTDTLTGYWRADRYTNYNYYNSSTGNWETREMKSLRINLVNFLQNRRLDWEFDDFEFRNGWKTIRAKDVSLSNDRVYEFKRR